MMLIVLLSGEEVLSSLSCTISHHVAPPLASHGVQHLRTWLLFQECARNFVSRHPAAARAEPCYRRMGGTRR
jgi:hypothetical protein